MPARKRKSKRLVPIYLAKANFELGKFHMKVQKQEEIQVGIVAKIIYWVGAEVKVCCFGKYFASFIKLKKLLIEDLIITIIKHKFV